MLVKDVNGFQLNIYRYFSGCCGCNAIVVDKRTKPNEEIRYWIHCNCRNGVEKQIRTLSKGKVSHTYFFESVDSIKQIELALDKTDSLVIYKLKDFVDFNLGECCGLESRLNLVKGFRMSKNPMPTGSKSLFKKRRRL